MAKQQNTKSIEQATEISWMEWKKWLDEMKAFDLSHQKIAELVFSKIENKVESAEWWSQGITVAYEQEIGRRMPGQRSDGTFEMSISKSINEERTILFNRCKELLDKFDSINGLQVLKPRFSETPARSNWRCDFSDGSKALWSVDVKTPEKSQLVIRQTHMTSSEVSALWKEFWTQFLNEHILK